MNIQTLEINGKEISYFVRKSSKAKRIIVKIDNKGSVELVLPKRVTYKEGTEFLLSKKEWIAKHINKRNEQKEKGFFFLGNSVTIKKEVGKTNSIRFSQEEKIIFCESVRKLDDKNIYETWLRISAKEYIPERVFYLANAYGFNVSRVTIRNQKTRWGSCTSKGSLSFNMHLMSFTADVIDYVIIHELCHLKYMNHSKSFWELVASFIPDYKEKRKILKERVLY